MANLIRKKQVDQVEFSGFIIEVADENYYPLSTNPSGYVDQTVLTSATGTLNSSIYSVSGVLNTKILNSGIAANAYTDAVSGVLSTRLSDSGSYLSGQTTSLSGYTVSVSGNLYASITGSSGVVSAKVDTASGYLKSYTDTTSGLLYNQIITQSNTTTVSGMASGTFGFTGNKTFNSPITAQRINISGTSTPTSISLIASSGVVSIAGNAGTFVSYYETGANASLWAVADSAGLPMIELFDDYTLILGHSSRTSITLSGLSGYVLMQNLPNQTQTGGLPVGSLFRSGNYLMIL
jgi:hypothetical protein